MIGSRRCGDHRSPVLQQRLTRRALSGLRDIVVVCSQVGIVRCIDLLLDLLLAIRPQGEHSCGITIPDRFIGVDDVDSPGQRR